MNFLIFSLWINIKKIVSSKLVLFVFILLPIFITVLVKTWAGEPIASINVGIVYDNTDSFQANIFNSLVIAAEENPFLNFTFYEDEYLLIRNVMYNTITMGYIFSDDIGNTNFGEVMVRLITSPRSIAYSIVNELIAEAILAQSLPYITIAAIEDFIPSIDSTDFVHGQIKQYLEQDIFMEPIFYSASPTIGTQNFSLQTKGRIFSGIVGLAILTITIFLAPIIIEEKTTGVLSPLKYYNLHIVYHISYWLAVLLTLFFVGLLGFIPIWLFFNGIFLNINTLFALFLYSLINVLVFFVISYYLKSASFIQTFGIFIVLLNIFFGGVLINLNEINTNIGFIQNFFPLFWFIEMIF